MKKIFLLLSVVAVASLTSCKKDRTCTCTTTITPAPTLPAGYSSTSTSETTYTKVTKGTAKRACVKTTETETGDTYSTVRDCKLK